jgi:hypothetical protein
MLDDGTYDALVVDVESLDDGRVAVDLTILTGSHRGDVVSVRAPTPPRGDVLDLLGIPATLRVTDGAPSVTFEP